MYTVIITNSPDAVKVPSICYDESGREPYLAESLDAAYEYANKLKEAFPSATYNVGKISV